MKSFYVLKVFNINSETEEMLNELSFDFGAEGVCENLTFEQSGSKYEPKTIETDTHNIEVYFSKRPSEEFMTAIEENFKDLDFKLEEQVEKDWLEEWKKGFEPFCLAGEIWIVPTWSETPKGIKHKIWMEPGMAFGTGTHETTQLASKFLEEIDLKNKKVIDVGTGTGILAMCCSKWGAEHIVGIEIEDVARDVARDNIRLNQIENIEIKNHLLNEDHDQYDVVIANIIDGVLIDLRLDLARVTKTNGYLVLTGILEERDLEFVKDFSWEKLGFEMVKRNQQGEWIGYLLKRIHS